MESPLAGFDPAKETEAITYLFVSLAKVIMSPAATTPVPAVARGMMVWPTVNAALVEVALAIAPAAGEVICALSLMEKLFRLSNSPSRRVMVVPDSFTLVKLARVRRAAPAVVLT